MNFSVDIETDGVCAENILTTIIENLICYDQNYKLTLNITELPEPADGTAADGNSPLRPFGAAD